MKNPTPSNPPPTTPTPQSPANAPAAAAAAAVDPGGHPDLTTRDLLTVEQAAAHLQLSTSSIRAYIREGRLKAFRVAGLRKVLIPRAELLALLEPARRPRPADPQTRRRTGRGQSRG